MFWSQSGRPNSIVTETNLNKVATITRDDRYMLVRILESMVHISKSSIHRILSKHLQMRCLLHMGVALSHVRANGVMCGSGERMGTEG